jgi:hypothetical protein
MAAGARGRGSGHVHWRTGTTIVEANLDGTSAHTIVTASAVQGTLKPSVPLWAGTLDFGAATSPA